MGSLQVSPPGFDEYLAAVAEHRNRLATALGEMQSRLQTVARELERTQRSDVSSDQREELQRQLRRSNEKLIELGREKQLLQASELRLTETVERLTGQLEQVRGELRLEQAEALRHGTAFCDLTEERERLAELVADHDHQLAVEREQWETTVVGLKLEIESVHEAARALEQQWRRRIAEGQATVGTSQPAKVESAGTELKLLQVEAVLEEVERLREERTALFAKTRELEREKGASIENLRLVSELRSLQLERSQLVRRLEERSALVEELDRLRIRVRDLERVESEKAVLVRELQRTRARLYKAPTNSGTFAVEEAGSGSPTERGGVEWALGELAEEVAARGAVVADALGFPVAASGESDLVEQLAAMTGMAARVGEQARSLLSLAEIVEVTVRDRVGLVVHTRFFPVEEDLMAVGVIAETLPEPASVDRVVARTVRGLCEPRTEHTEPELHTTAR